jgi:hypothetical protein
VKAGGSLQIGGRNTKEKVESGLQDRGRGTEMPNPLLQRETSTASDEVKREVDATSL